MAGLAKSSVISLEAASILHDRAAGGGLTTAEYIERDAAKNELLSGAVCIYHPEFLLCEDAVQKWTEGLSDD